MDFPKKQQQNLIPRYLLQYLTSLEYHHTDPTAPWGGGGGGTYTAGDGIEISDEDVISIDDTVALKTDLSDYVTSTALATELLDYAELDDLATVATSGDYNDLLNKPTIPVVPTNVSAFTNDAGYITSSVLSGYATESWVTNQGYQNATDVYVRVQLMLQPYATEQWVTNQGYSTFSGSYNDLTNKPDLSIYELAADAFSGDYNDLINKPTIPVVPTNVSAFTNDAGYITSSALNNCVRTSTDQNITGIKTFVGDKRLKFKQSGGAQVLGFTAYNTNNDEIGNLQIANRTVSGSSNTYVTLGNYSSLTSKAKVGFRIQPNSSTNSFNFVMPFGTYSEFTDNTYSTTADTTIPCAFTDGTTIVKADATGLIDLSTLNLGTSYTAGTGIDITNDTISIDNTVALKSEIPTVPTNVSAFTNDVGYITSSALTGYATESWVTNQGYLTSSDLTDYVTTNTTQTITGTKTFQGTYYTTKINDISGLTVSGYGATAKLSDSISLSSSSGGFAMNGSVLVVNNLDNNYDIQIISGSSTVGQYTFKNKTGDVAVTSEIPTSATSTSTSTFTPTTETLTFTYSDNTTATITIVTAATVSTTTTTTLS